MRESKMFFKTPGIYFYIAENMETQLNFKFDSTCNHNRTRW